MAEKQTFIFCDTNHALIDALEDEARRRVANSGFNLAAVNKDIDFNFRRQDIFSVGADCFVSPANSFGYMNGGIDALYACGDHTLQDAVFQVVDDRGEMLIGQAYAFRPSFGMLIVAPTMRLPAQEVRPIDCFLATSAAIQMAWRLASAKEKIFRSMRVAIPGMGTGAGGLHVELAAAAMLGGVEYAIKGIQKRKNWQSLSSAFNTLIRPAAQA